MLKLIQTRKPLCHNNFEPFKSVLGRRLLLSRWGTSDLPSGLSSGIGSLGLGSATTIESKCLRYEIMMGMAKKKYASVYRKTHDIG